MARNKPTVNALIRTLCQRTHTRIGQDFRLFANRTPDPVHGFDDTLFIRSTV